MIEPVKGVGDGDRVDGCVGERDRLGETLAHALGSHAGGQHLAQRTLRLDGHHVEAAGEQRSRELARAGRQVEHGGAGTDPELGRERTDHRRRVLRTTPLVGGGNRREALCEGMQGHRRSVSVPQPQPEASLVARSRSSMRRILPVSVFGSSATNSTRRG